MKEARKIGELTTKEAQKIVDLIQNFDIFDSEYLYNIEEVKEEHRTEKQKQNAIDYLEEIKKAECGELEELEKAINEVIEILKTRQAEQKLSKKLGKLLMPGM